MSPLRGQAPEGAGAESRLIIAGWGAGGLIARDHVLQGSLLDHVETDAHAASPLHVIDVVGLEDGVDCQVLNIQLHTHCRKTLLVHIPQPAPLRGHRAAQQWSDRSHSASVTVSKTHTVRSHLDPFHFC